MPFLPLIELVDAAIAYRVYGRRQMARCGFRILLPSGRITWRRP